MLLLRAMNILKSHGDRQIIKFDDFKVYSGDKIGIVGANGSGKTTLLNILASEDLPDEGKVEAYCNISYIRQTVDRVSIEDYSVAGEFKVADVDPDKNSGGEKTRIKLANGFSVRSGLLLADEPTTNLDYKGVEILLKKLQEVESFLIVSHDRDLLDKVCTGILEIEDSTIELYPGNYTSYREQKDLIRRTGMYEYEKYVQEKAKLLSALVDRTSKAKKMRKTPKRMGNSEARLHKRSTTEKQEKINNAANSIKSRLDRLEVKDRPEDTKGIKIDFSLTSPPVSKNVIYAEGLNFSYGSRIIFENASFSVPNGKKTFIRAENGAGKTTLLNLIYNHDSSCIRVSPGVKFGYFTQDLSSIDDNESILDNVIKDSIQSIGAARNILAGLLFKGDEVYKGAGVLSGGEKIRVALAKLILSDNNVLLLDEPTNYLDVQAMEALQDVIGEYEGTVLLISHDRAFTNALADKLMIIENHKITEFAGNLDDYETWLCERTSDKSKEKMILEMNLSRILSEISSGNRNREELESEYMRTLDKINKFK